MIILNEQAKPTACHAYTVQLREGKWVTSVSPTTGYGYYEHDTQGEGGGLWFETEGDTLSLTDYDGRSCLPRDVATALRAAGYIVSEDFDW